VKAILETFQSVEHARSLWRLFQKLFNLLSMERFWNSLHKERAYSTDWKVSGVTFTRNAHTQQIGKAFLVKAILETFQSIEHERSLWKVFQKLSNLLSMSVPCEGYSRNFPICWVWAFLVKAILEAIQSVEYERSLWRNSLHKERACSTDWKVSRIAFTRNAHTQQIEQFLE
jgi:hypothetical protein